MEIQQLKHFLAVVEQGTIGNAAEVCNITQSGLSRSIKNLENTIGLPLLKRNPRGVEPTAFGESLISRARLIVNVRNRAMEEFEEIRTAKAGIIKIGITPNFAHYFTSQVIKKYNSERVQADFQVTSGASTALIQKLLHGELDFVFGLFGVNADINEDLVVEPLFDSHSVVLASKDHPLSGKERIEVSDIAAASWAITDAPGLHEAFAEFFTERSLEVPRLELRSNSITFLLQAVMELGLITILPRSLLKSPLASDLLELRVETPGGFAKAGFIYRADELLFTPAIKKLMYWFRTEASASLKTS